MSLTQECQLLAAFRGHGSQLDGFRQGGWLVGGPRLVDCLDGTRQGARAIACRQVDPAGGDERIGNGVPEATGVGDRLGREGSRPGRILGREHPRQLGPHEDRYLHVLGAHHRLVRLLERRSRQCQ